LCDEITRYWKKFGEQEMIKRIISFVLAVVLLCGLLPQLSFEAGAITFVLDAQEINGRAFSSAYGEKLNHVFRGEVALFSNSDVSLPLGTNMSTGTSYTVAETISGYQCYAYAQAVYYYLFGDIVYHGSGLKYWSNSKRVLSNKTYASYELFSQAGVGFGAYIRTTTSKSGAYNGEKGHSIIVLAYNEETITYLEGNADGKGLIRVTEMTWEEFDEIQLSGRNRRIAHVVQCIDAACGHTQYSPLGVCMSCGAAYDFSYEFNAGNREYYIVTREEGAQLKQELPYREAETLRTLAYNDRVELLGSVENAFGETWYQVFCEGQTGYVAAEDLMEDPITPGKPVVKLTTDYTDEMPVVASWKTTANTTRYDLTLQMKDQEGQWQDYAYEPEADSGISWSLQAGEYQLQLRACNTEAEDGEVYTQAETVTFQIVHIHSYMTVSTAHATCTATGEVKYLCKDCGISYTETLPMEPHDYENMRCLACNAAEKPVCDLTVTCSSGKPALSWDKVTGAKKYEVYRATSETGNYTRLTTTTKRSYTDSKASSDKQYFYKIRVVSSNESNGKYSAVRSAYARPVVKTALTEEGNPVISWGEVNGALSYKVYRSTKSGSGYKAVATIEECTYTDLAVTTGKTYYYKVVAVGADGVSAYSSYKKVAAKCVAPDLQADDSAGKPALSWNKVSGAKKYEVYRSTNGGKFTKLTTTTKTSYTDSKATGGAVCTYKVRALGSSSSYHSAYSETVDCTVACTAPSLTVKVSSTTGKPELGWKKITGAVSYEIYRSENDGEFILMATQTAVSYKDTDAQAGVQYTYKIRALGKAEIFHSADSTAKSATAQCAQPKPKGKISKDGKPVLVWGEVEDADSYLIYRSTSKSYGYKLLDETDDLTYTDTTAKKNKTYYYKIVAQAGSTQSTRSGYVKLKAKK
jgi:fibronectin type 3 domain-containing protein